MTQKFQNRLSRARSNHMGKGSTWERFTFSFLHPLSLVHDFALFFNPFHSRRYFILVNFYQNVYFWLSVNDITAGNYLYEIQL